MAEKKNTSKKSSASAETKQTDQEKQAELLIKKFPELVELAKKRKNVLE